ncbi:winged helix-turn-helix domain-containing protein [Mucilaginibacter flavus]|uniref:winged helix-turn-helix domain-containing protein n=1 Tax=Mucilaginibacter flavus TaxID=931504 RepID=UPI0025B56E1C|nr:winged helix-turn-helix domain-containing protein [Mucilaginibacter flavus]MDN3584583.1 winged helix-turn-helix domain-containing protein [Mucilaginibacter flavus]
MAGVDEFPGFIFNLGLMNLGPFILNERFVIEPSLGSVQDKQAGTSTRIEPRLMDLLCMLVQYQGQLVSRAAITKEVWNDYGSADEGLTQAISYLRKLLADDEKSMIETIPKKGYILRAVATWPAVDSKEIPTKFPSRKKVIWGICIFAFLLLAAIFFYRLFNQEKSINNDAIRQNQKQSNPNAGDKSKNPDALPDTATRQETSGDTKR